MQLQAILGLKIDHQTVTHAALVAENGVGCGTEVDLDVCIPAGHTLAGTDVKRDTRPSPVVDFCTQGHKGFGVAMWVDTHLFAVTWH